jgi:hypothetical protein
MRTIHPPFIIGPRLTPAMQVAGATLSLMGIERAGKHQRARFALDLDGVEYLDDNLRSGVSGFRSSVEVFESYLSFLGACAESVRYADRTGRDPGENSTLFPAPVARWAADNADEIAMARFDLCDDDGMTVRHSLIEG